MQPGMARGGGQTKRQGDGGLLKERCGGQEGEEEVCQSVGMMAKERVKKKKHNGRGEEMRFNLVSPPARLR